MLILVCAPCAFHSPAVLAQETEVDVLARVDLTAPIKRLKLPAHAWLQDALGQEYLLVIGTETRLAQSGWPYRLLSTDARAEEYVFAVERRPGARAAAAKRYSVLHDDGIRLVVRATPDEAEELAGMGFAMQRMSGEPIVWPRGTPASTGMKERRKDFDAFTPDPLVGEMISRVQQTNLLVSLRRVSGEEPVAAGGDAYVIATRHTASGTSVQNATQFAYEHIQALGLDVRYHNWNRSGYANRNVIGTQPGTVYSNELVLITAHLDDMPGGARAPGADDNASGSVAVLTAAGLFSQLRFERTVRFVLFTGEEQGLLGSAQYAADAYAAGDNIVAVFNMDMLAWDGSGGPRLRLHTRTTGNPGYSNDLFIASVFTNVVSTYGLSNSLTPVITPDADGASDHSSFWSKGYPAIFAEQDYPGDFNPYYHTANDTLAHLNMNYFTAYARAALGTVAHLAQPTGSVPFAAIEVVNSDWTPGSGIGAGVFYAKHEMEATESGLEPRDVAWSNAPPNPNSKWLKIYTDPYGVELMTDSRPVTSQTVFVGKLSVVDSIGTGVSCSNRLRFDFLAPPESNRVYTVRIHVDGRYIQPATDFDCVTNLQEVIASGGYVNLPTLNQASNGVVYGTCDIFCAPSIALIQPTNNATFVAPATIEFETSVLDFANSISRVEFYADAVQLGHDDTPPYTLIWSNVPGGNYSLTAWAIYNSGLGTNTSPAILVSVDWPPNAPDKNTATVQNQLLLLAYTELLAGASDPDGDPLTVVSASGMSTSGGAVSLTSSNLNYMPMTDFTGLDLFTYTISDGRGGTVTVRVQITVISSNALALNIVSPPMMLSNGFFHVGFAGVPGLHYSIQYSPRAAGPWTALTNMAAGDTGLFEFEDPTEGVMSRFYRCVYP
jgi:hypothetical protein